MRNDRRSNSPNGFCRPKLLSGARSHGQGIRVVACGVGGLGFDPPLLTRVFSLLRYKVVG